MAYALVTGASKGIGKAIAEELAKRKHDLLLIARSGELLQQVAEGIIVKFKVKVSFLSIDLSEIASANNVFEWCTQNNYQVNIVVNNAGYGLSGRFEDYSIADNSNMMQLNMLTLVQLCQLFLPSLKQQSKAYILNIASSAAYQAVPGLSLYAATKVFVLNFSRGLKQELHNSSVSVTCVCPGSTDTDFSVRAKVSIRGLQAAEKVNMTAESVAKIAVNGMFKGKAEIITGIVNKIGAFGAWILPKVILERIAMKIYN
jgi:uncharacterized protein